MFPVRDPVSLTPRLKCQLPEDRHGLYFVDYRIYIFKTAVTTQEAVNSYFTMELIKSQVLVE